MHILPVINAAFADLATDRGDDAGIAEIDFRQIEQGLLGLGVGAQLQFLGIEHGQFAPLGFERGLVAGERRLKAFCVGIGLLDPLLGAERGRQQLSLSLVFEFGAFRSAWVPAIALCASATTAFWASLRALRFSIAAWAPRRSASACATLALYNESSICTSRSPALTRSKSSTATWRT